jgi:hypothetical protein
MRTNALFIFLVCLGACSRQQAHVPPPEPVDARPWCERIDYDWATPNGLQPSTSTPSVALLGFASIDKNMIRQPIRENMWATERCYQLALEHNPNLSGRITVRFEIGGDGSVGAIEVVDDTLADPCVGRCVIEVGKRLWSWPRIRGAGTIVIHYPFLFAPS